MNKNTYTGITIGPIYDTFTQAKRTRAIWAASYFFSFFMRKILERAISEEWEVHLPYDYKLANEKVRGSNKGKYGAGLYADRLYFKSKTKTELQQLANDTIDCFADNMAKFISKERDEIKTFLTNYLNLHIVEITLTDDELNEIKNSKDENGKPNNSALHILNELLDNKELNKRYVFKFEDNYLIEYFTAGWNENTALKIDAFGTAADRHFTSIGEISSSDLKRNYKVAFDQALANDFKNADIEFLDLLAKTTKKNTTNDGVSIVEDYHKYYAVLYADGDNISALLKSVANEDIQLKAFSKKLLEFGHKAEQSVVNYGGKAIYLGGEDILAFLPIACNDGNQLKSLAVLIHDLDKDFHDTIGKCAEAQNVKIPTLSYGLMLAYYKFPIREAMSHAHHLLELCKKEKKLFPDKNGISVRFQKHSGQYMECHIDKSKEESTKLIYDLLTLQLQGKDKKDTLSGLIQRLKSDVFFTTFIYAVRNDRIDPFFENFFNEEIHKEKTTFTDYFKALANALKKEYLSAGITPDKEKEENKRYKDILFTVLRYYQFIQPKEN